MKCEVCGADPVVNPTVALIRQNPKGEAGVWRCQVCNQLPVHEDVQDIIDTVLESNK